MSVRLFVLSEIREAFRVLDRDGNGFISKQELGMAMRSLGYMPSEVELAIIMQRLDMDGEFKLTCMEFNMHILMSCRNALYAPFPSINTMKFYVKFWSAIQCGLDLQIKECISYTKKPWGFYQ